MSGEQEPIPVALVGAGMIGSLRARAIRKMPKEFRLVAIADEREDAARAIAKGDADIHIYADVAEVAKDDRVEAVIVSTPPVSHESIGVPCLEAGKHVLCEKPLARTVEECERLVSAAENAGVCLATGFTLRHTPAARLARRLVDEGAIGRIDHIRAFHGHRGGSDFGPPWITDRSVTGGGTLMDNGIHMIDLTGWFLGKIDKSIGFASNHTWKKEGCEDNGFVLMRDAHGSIGLVHGSWTEWRGYGYRMEIYGTTGSVRFSYPPLWLTHTQGQPGEKMKTRRFFFPAYQVLERIRGWQWSLIDTLVHDLRDWGRAIRSETSACSTGRDGLEAVRVATCVE